MGSDQQYREGVSAGTVELFVMLVEELDAQGAIDKGLLLKRIFDKIAELDGSFGAELSAKDAGIIFRLRSVARPLDRKERLRFPADGRPVLQEAIAGDAGHKP